MAADDNVLGNPLDRFAVDDVVPWHVFPGPHCIFWLSNQGQGPKQVCCDDFVSLTADKAGVAEMPVVDRRFWVILVLVLEELTEDETQDLEWDVTDVHCGRIGTKG
jgi:hypothetical protein